MNGKLQIVSRGTLEPVALERLVRMSPDELRGLHRKMFGCDPASGNSEQARRRIAWQLQVERESGLPASARQHALAIAGKTGLRIRVPANAAGLDPIPHATVTRLVSDHDPRVPMPGSVIVKEYRGRTIVVHVFESGFECDGRRFASLSAIAKDITGTKWNGFAFFGMAKGRACGR